MRVDINMTEDKELKVGCWWAKTPDFVIASLQTQLEAAQTVWPELKQYTLTKKCARKRSD